MGRVPNFAFNMGTVTDRVILEEEWDQRWREVLSISVPNLSEFWEPLLKDLEQGEVLVLVDPKIYALQPWRYEVEERKYQ